jgi:hypothetical protein
MKQYRVLAGLLGVAALLAIAAAEPVRAASATVIGRGNVATAGAGAAFEIDLGDSRGFTFSYVDYSANPARAVSIAEPLEVDCLGELFGGQAVRLTGSGADSAAPGRPLTAQLYLVDGGAPGADKISLKVTETDGSVVYFTPLRTLQSGDLVVSCGS